MPYKKEIEEIEVVDMKPFEVVPLSETFKEDLFVLYERYTPKESQTNYLGDY